MPVACTVVRANPFLCPYWRKIRGTLARTRGAASVPSDGPSVSEGMGGA